MIKEAIAKAADKIDLTSEEMEGAMSEIFEGAATNAQIAALLTALRMKGETIEEIAACAKAMRAKALRLPYDGDLLEIVGTGGDRSFSFNISTTAAFVIAASGIKVGKHGNRGVSSKSGAADVLEVLGADIMLDIPEEQKLLADTNMVFFFAQKHHAGMRFAGPVRKEIGIRTVFNILGPLTNPGFANMQVMGIYDKNLVKPMAQVLSKLGVTRGFVVNGDGMDEFSLSGVNVVAEIDGEKITMLELTAADFGLPAVSSKEVYIGGDATVNAEITKAILSGKEQGAKRDIVLLNAAAGLYLGRKAASVKEGVKLAAELIDSGKALATMEAFIKESAELAKK